jgi:hypothetical protein
VEKLTKILSKYRNKTSTIFTKQFKRVLVTTKNTLHIGKFAIPVKALIIGAITLILGLGSIGMFLGINNTPKEKLLNKPPVLVHFNKNNIPNAPNPTRSPKNKLNKNEYKYSTGYPFYKKKLNNTTTTTTTEKNNKTTNNSVNTTNSPNTTIQNQQPGTGLQIGLSQQQLTIFGHTIQLPTVDITNIPYPVPVIPGQTPPPPAMFPFPGTPIPVYTPKYYRDPYTNEAGYFVNYGNTPYQCPYYGEAPEYTQTLGPQFDARSGNFDFGSVTTRVPIVFTQDPNPMPESAQDPWLACLINGQRFQPFPDQLEEFAGNNVFAADPPFQVWCVQPLAPSLTGSVDIAPPGSFTDDFQLGIDMCGYATVVGSSAVGDTSEPFSQNAWVQFPNEPGPGIEIYQDWSQTISQHVTYQGQPVICPLGTFANGGAEVGQFRSTRIGIGYGTITPTVAPASIYGQEPSLSYVCEPDPGNFLNNESYYQNNYFTINTFGNWVGQSYQYLANHLGNQAPIDLHAYTIFGFFPPAQINQLISNINNNTFSQFPQEASQPFTLSTPSNLCSVWNSVNVQDEGAIYLVPGVTSMIATRYCYATVVTTAPPVNLQYFLSPQWVATHLVFWFINVQASYVYQFWAFPLPNVDPSRLTGLTLIPVN